MTWEALPINYGRGGYVVTCKAGAIARCARVRDVSALPAAVAQLQQAIAA
jgi:hypothetical protein